LDIVAVVASCVIGVDLGGTKLLAGAVDASLGVHHRTRRTVAGLDQAAVLATILDAVAETREAVGNDVSAVGFGIPATFDRRTGIAVQAVHLPIRDLAFRDLMSERLGLPVAADNDGNCAALLEARHGAGRGHRYVVLLALGTGIAGGMVLDGRLERGAIGAGAELGHMVIDHDGPPCQGGCPNHGCLESLASGSALGREAAALLEERSDTALGEAVRGGLPLTGALVTELAHDGDPVARAAVDRIGCHLGVGIANVVNIFNPDVVVIGGGVIAAGEMLLEPARREMLSRALSPAREHVQVRAAAFGEEAGMVGAAVLAQEEAVRQAAA
jgi:glucokinase